MARQWAQKHLDKFEAIKKDIDDSYSFMRANIKRFNEFRKYLYQEQIDPNFAGILDELQLPQLEFNVLYPYHARLLGEFSHQEPSPVITSVSGKQADPKTMEVVQNYFRHLIDAAKDDDVLTEGMKTLLSGGFAVLKLEICYLHNKSMDQEAKFCLAYASDMCGFDPIAVMPHKGDGKFCWEAYPKTEEELKELAKEQGYDIDFNKLSFARKAETSTGGATCAPLQWSYTSQNEKIGLVFKYYYKERKRIKLVKVRAHQVFNHPETQKKYGVKDNVMKKDDYDRFVEDWEAHRLIEQPPGMIGEPRNSYEESICCYTLLEGQLLDYEETIFSILPLVFCGNSTRIRVVDSGRMEEFTMPHGYHARGMQDLKNYAGNLQVNELQNLIQHKFMIAEEALPSSQEYQKSYKDVQHANLLVYKAYADFNPDKPLPAPQVINRQIVPPIISESFVMADQGMQNAMGSYDAQLGINDNQLSGVAIVNAATQNNAVGMPYIKCMMVALSHVFTGILRMLPKLIVTPRTIPVKDHKGEHGYALVNQPSMGPDGQPQEIKFDYDEDDLKVRVEAGVNYEIQRMSNLQMINQGMSANPAFGQFMATKGLKVYVKNLKVTNSEELVEAVDEWQQEMKQQQQMAAKASQQGQQNNPLVMKEMNTKMEIQRKAQHDQIQAKLDAAKIGIAQQDLQLKESEAKANMAIQLDKHAAEKMRSSVDLAMSAVGNLHGVEMDHKRHYHGVEMDHKRHHHEVARTLLEHARHESKESAKQESKEHK